MIYRLDSNTCITFLRSRPSATLRRMQQTPAQDMTLCAIVVAELYEGAYRSARQAENLDKVFKFAQAFTVLPFDTAAAVIAGQHGASLAAQGLPIGPHDLQIAAIALVHNLTLVTNNTCEFQHIPGLRLEDWERDVSTATP